jgi:hypothetical protein
MNRPIQQQFVNRAFGALDNEDSYEIGVSDLGYAA